MFFGGDPDSFQIGCRFYIYFQSFVEINPAGGTTRTEGGDKLLFGCESTALTLAFPYFSV